MLLVSGCGRKKRQSATPVYVPTILAYLGYSESGYEGATVIDGESVSLLVSTRNRPQLLIDAVQSVLGGSALPDEIVIVDQSDIPNQVVAACFRCQTGFLSST